MKIRDYENGEQNHSSLELLLERFMVAIYLVWLFVVCAGLTLFVLKSPSGFGFLVFVPLGLVSYGLLFVSGMTLLKKFHQSYLIKISPRPQKARVIRLACWSIAGLVLVVNPLRNIWQWSSVERSGRSFENAHPCEISESSSSRYNPVFCFIKLHTGTDAFGGKSLF